MDTITSSTTSTDGRTGTKGGVVRRAVAAVVLSATVAGGLGLVGAGTASALPRQCAYMLTQVDSYRSLYDDAAAAGNWSAANGYWREMQYYAKRAKAAGCYG